MDDKAPSWIINHDEVLLFNVNTGSVIGFEYICAQQGEYAVRLNKTHISYCDTAADAIAFIDGLAQLLGAASVPMPPVEPDDKPDPF